MRGVVTAPPTANALHRSTHTAARASIRPRHTSVTQVTSLNFQCIRTSNKIDSKTTTVSRPHLPPAFEMRWSSWKGSRARRAAHVTPVVIQWAGSSTGRASECHCFSCGAFFLHVSVANDGQWRARAALIGARRGGGAARPALLAVLAMFVFRMQLFSKMSRWYTSSSYQHTTSLGNERPSSYIHRYLAPSIRIELQYL